MNDIQCLSHTKWECKYHVVWIPKYRRKVLYGQLRKNLGEVFHELARPKDSNILEGHLLPDHVHKLILILPKYSVAQVVGYIKGKSAIHIARTCRKPGISKKKELVHKLISLSVAVNGTYEEMMPQEKKNDSRGRDIRYPPREFRLAAEYCIARLS